MEMVDELKTINASTLQTADLKPPDFIVKNILPEGVGILAAKPKLGKSWICMDLSISVVKGSDFIGFPSKRSEVLYLALEDSFNRIQSRLKKLTRDENVSDGLHIAIQSNMIDAGLIEQLNVFLAKHPKTKLVIIDTLQKVKPLSDKRLSAYEQDYQVLSKLQEVAKQYHICILCVHHTRKAVDPNDPFSNILGSTALQGAVDTMWILQKKVRKERNAILHVEGRDTGFIDIELFQDKNTCRWVTADSASNTERIDQEREVLNHPAVSHIMSVVEKENVYVNTMGGLLADALMGDGAITEKKLSDYIKKHDELLKRNGIDHEYPESVTRINGISGRYHTFYRKNNCYECNSVTSSENT